MINNQIPKIVSGHQPAYLPWLGYFHKLLICDNFIYMDTVKYSRGWINKNVINGKNNTTTLSVPIFSSDKNEEIKKVRIKDSEGNIIKENHLRSIYLNYKNSKYFEEIYYEIENIYKKNYIFLSDLCYDILIYFLDYLNINTKITKMSNVKFEGKKNELLLSHAKKTESNILFLGSKAKVYIDEKFFREKNIMIYFQDYVCNNYHQLSTNFVKNCSVLDLVMNEGKNSIEIIKKNNLTKNQLIDIYFEKFN